MQAESRIDNLCDLALAAQYLPALLATWLLIGDVIGQPVSTLKGWGTLFSRSKLVRTEPPETAAGIRVFLTMLTPVAMAFRKESKNEEGSGCNGASMDTVLQAAARMTKNQASLVSRVCKLHRRRLQYNSRAAFTEYLYGKRSPSVL